MSDINAAIGIVQLEKYKKMIEHKKAIARLYDDAFVDIPGIITIQTNYENTALFMYCVRINKNRNRFINFLKEKGIPTGVHYLPSHKFSLYYNSKCILPITEKIAGQIVTLPLYYDMTSKDAHQVINVISEYFKLNAR